MISIPSDVHIEYMTKLNIIDLASLYNVNIYYRDLLNTPYILTSLAKQYNIPDVDNFYVLFVVTILPYASSNIYGDVSHINLFLENRETLNVLTTQYKLHPTSCFDELLKQYDNKYLSVRSEDIETYFECIARLFPSGYELGMDIFNFERLLLKSTEKGEYKIYKRLKKYLFKVGIYNQVRYDQDDEYDRIPNYQNLLISSILGENAKIFDDIINEIEHIIDTKDSQYLYDIDLIKKSLGENLSLVSNIEFFDHVIDTLEEFFPVIANLDAYLSQRLLG
jgi:hypothetical protein